MSTKIYSAYRFKREHLDEFVQKMEDIVFERLTKFLTEAVKGAVAARIPGQDDEILINLAEWHFRYTDKTPKEIRQWVADNPEKSVMMYLLYEAMSASKQQIGFGNLDSAINLWPHGDYFYCIPYNSDYAGVIKPDDIGPWCEDYSYWNNTDQPDEITRDDWVARGDTWDAVCGTGGIDGHNHLRLEKVFVEAKGYPCPGLSRLVEATGIYTDWEATFLPGAIRDVVNTVAERHKQLKEYGADDPKVPSEAKLLKLKLKMPQPRAKRIPIAEARRVAFMYGYDQVILWGWNRDKNQQHMTTFGKTLIDCDQAAQGGNGLKEKLFGWPASECCAEPDRVKKLKEQIKGKKA